LGAVVTGLVLLTCLGIAGAAVFLAVAKVGTLAGIVGGTVRPAAAEQ
jgi:hypothetical protein